MINLQSEFIADTSKETGGRAVFKINGETECSLVLDKDADFHELVALLDKVEKYAVRHTEATIKARLYESVDSI